LYKVKKSPDAASFSPGRIYNMIMKYGVEDVSPVLKIRGYEDLVKYKFFDGKIYGTLEPIHDLMRFLKAAARRTETGKRIVVMVGPVGSGKSTISNLIKRGLELDDTPIFAIKGCPINEEPLHLIPIEDRPFWEEQLGVKIEGTLCPVCQQMMELNFKDENGHINWENVTVEQVKLSEQKRIGIGTFQPSDPKSQDVSELIGRVNLSKINRYGETDPRAYQFNGELQVSNRGLVEYIELMKADIKFHYVLITAAQEQLIKSPGFPQMYIDTLILAHTNQTEFDAFRSEKKNEALHDRMYTVSVPWNLRVSDEIEIYKKMIKESQFKDIHIAPHTLKIAAEFAILSRLVPTTKISSLVKKMKLYDGEVTDEFKKEEIDVKALFEEGRAKGEGMSGISPRFIINALNIALGMKEDKRCINPIDIIRALRTNFEHHIGIKDEDVERYMSMLVGEKDSVSSEYRDIAKKTINMAFLHAYAEQAQTLFENYILHAEAFCRKEKVYDSITGEYSTPDEKLMRGIEEIISVPQNSKSEFRNGIFVYKSTCLERKEPFTFNTYAPLKQAIETKLMSDLKNVVSLTLVDKSAIDTKVEKRRNDAFNRLLENGFCEQCANVILTFVGEILRRE